MIEEDCANLIVLARYMQILSNRLANGRRKIERRVLARAIKYHIEHRVLINNMKTVAFH